MITQWNQETQMWNPVFKDVTGILLGHDFEFENQQGYFVLVSQSTTWVPTVMPAAPAKALAEEQVSALTGVTAIQDLTVGNLSSASVTLAFRSDGVGRTTIEYGTDPNLTELEVLVVETPSSAHYIQLKGLHSQSQYYAGPRWWA